MRDIKCPLVVSAAALLFFSGPSFAQVQRELIVMAQMPDYPAEALTAKSEGDVPIRLHIEPDGTLRCTLREPRGPARLLRPSCALVAGRWPYGPNADEHGALQPTDVDLIVRWRINPDLGNQNYMGGATPISPASWMSGWDYPFSAIQKKREGTIKVLFDVNEHGQMENCAPEEPVAFKVLAKTVCPLLLKRSMLLPAVGPGGEPRRSKGSYKVRFQLAK